MKSTNIYNTITGIISVIGACLSSIVGGYDSLFSLCLTLVIMDIITGFLNAWYRKEVSSTVLRRGLINKIFYIFYVWIGILGDKVLIQVIGHNIMFGENEVLLRNVIIIYIILEELVSLLENFALIGMPLPKWLLSSLQQVQNVADSTTVPKFFIKWFKEKFGLDLDMDKTIDNDNKIEDKEEQDN